MRHLHRKEVKLEAATVQRELHEHHPVEGFENNMQIHLALKMAGDFKSLADDTAQAAYRADIEADLQRALHAMVVHIEGGQV